MPSNSTKNKKRCFFLAVILVFAYGYIQARGFSFPSFSSWTQNIDNPLQQAYANRRSGLQVQGEGVVIKIFPDDLEGSRHQRFVLKLSSGQTLMVAHNIDLAPRIRNLNRGDKVKFYGEYEWNEKGGLIHWTHHDPSDRHVGGWIKHDRKMYK